MPLKFSNGLKIHGLLPGEQLEELTFQPGNWRRWLLFFQRPILANTLLFLTSNYLGVIKEELNLAHGWIISHIPRNNIVGIQSRPNSRWNELGVLLKQGDHSTKYEFRLEDETARAWSTQWTQHGFLWQDIPLEA